MQWLIYLIILIVLALVLVPSLPSPSTGDPRLPTVSQSRKGPFAVGRILVRGPNVLDATKYTSIDIKKGNFLSKQKVGARYFQDIEMAIAWDNNAGDSELFEIRAGEFTAWSGNLTVAETININEPDLFGSSDAEGGLAGFVDFIPGVDTGTVSSTMETLTERDQPGYPGMARCLFHGPGLAVRVPGLGYRGVGDGFYWGNSVTYKPISFVYGFYPNPQAATDHRIGDMANPAYVLLSLHRDSRYGLGDDDNVDQAAITTMAATLYSEGFGISRVWYDATAIEVEAEILQLVDAIRYRSLINGKTVYALIRDDFDISTIPTIGDDEIEVFKLKSDSLTNTATRISVEYVDIDANYKTIKVSASNTAVRQSIGRAITVNTQFWGAGTAAQAQKIASREALKRTRPRRRGEIICDRTAWDWKPGDTVLVSWTPYSIASMPIRIVEHSKGKLTNGKVKFTWIEEVFEFGKTIFAAQDTSQENFQSDPADVSDFIITEDPWFLTASETNVARLRIGAVDPNNSNGYLFTDTTATPDNDYGPFSFSSFYAISTAADRSGTTLVISGFVGFITRATTSETVLADRGGEFLCYVETTDGLEIFGFTRLSYDTATNTTTLTGCMRGLIDTYPKDIAVSDKVWFIFDLETVAGAPEETNSYAFRPQTPRGVLAADNASSRSHTYTNRHERAAPAGNVRINNTLFPTSVTGPVAVTWNHRNSDEQIAGGLLEWDDDTSQTLPDGVTYRVTFIDDDTSTQLQRTSSLTDETNSWDDPGADYNLLIRVETLDSSGVVFDTFEYVAPFTQAP